MAVPIRTQARNLLDDVGLTNVGQIYRNLPTSVLYEHIIRNKEGLVADTGPLVVTTGAFTGRTPKDKFIVRDTTVDSSIWWGEVNQAISPHHFDAIHRQMIDYFAGHDVYVLDTFVGADARYRMPVRLITTSAWHKLFADIMFISGDDDVLPAQEPRFTILHAPHFKITPHDVYGLRSSTCILVNFTKRLILIGGTIYAGEIKKSIFSVLNYLLPKSGVLTMHCSANYGANNDDVALFFGLSGTGKTTLSNDPNRTLIGDDEHGWGDDGIFNLEGGCYAKVIRLSASGEPEIYAQTHRFGTVLENVVIDPETRRINLDDDSLTENTRAAYRITNLKNVDVSGVAGHPKHVIFLTADAFGVLPPVSRLTPEQALYYFISGYTAKVAGTERGVDEPQATFSACFGAPFMPLHPAVYADLLHKKLRQHDVKTWLVNTGWTGGAYGVGHRIALEDTRTIISAILNDTLDDAPYEVDAVFGLRRLAYVPGVPMAILKPRDTWADSSAYDRKAQQLAVMFIENFAQFADHVAPEVVAAGPQL
ncbi:MAG: phosphoenolpyruvate carboxykinase (ATP) [Phototrophicales bacterium]|nr:MAG: phosphoenolpyruvate carboxykinase (ATP) [Phototrophicales bacterium]